MTFKSIPGISSNYVAGEDGIIYSCKTKGPNNAGKKTKWRSLSGSADKDGYLRTCLRGEAKHTYQVHRLVCLAFHGLPRIEQTETRHLDGDRKNNIPSNLAWGTNSENQADRVSHGRDFRGERNPFAKYSNQTRAAVQAMHRSGVAYRKVALHFNIPRGTVYHIITNGAKYPNGIMQIPEAK